MQVAGRLVDRQTGRQTDKEAILSFIHSYRNRKNIVRAFELLLTFFIKCLDVKRISGNIKFLF